MTKVLLPSLCILCPVSLVLVQQFQLLNSAFTETPVWLKVSKHGCDAVAGHSLRDHWLFVMLSRRWSGCFRDDKHRLRLEEPSLLHRHLQSCAEPGDKCCLGKVSDLRHSTLCPACCECRPVSRPAVCAVYTGRWKPLTPSPVRNRCPFLSEQSSSAEVSTAQAWLDRSLFLHKPQKFRPRAFFYFVGEVSALVTGLFETVLNKEQRSRVFQREKVNRLGTQNLPFTVAKHIKPWKNTPKAAELHFPVGLKWEVQIQQ